MRAAEGIAAVVAEEEIGKPDIGGEISESGDGCGAGGESECTVAVKAGDSVVLRVVNVDTEGEMMPALDNVKVVSSLNAVDVEVSGRAGAAANYESALTAANGANFASDMERLRSFL